MKKRSYSVVRVPRAKLIEKSDHELLTTVWHRWRVAQWNGRPVFQAFSDAAVRRIDACQPEWRTYASLLDRQAIKGRDTRSTRMEVLRALFLQGRSPLDLPEPEEADEPPMALVAA